VFGADILVNNVCVYKRLYFGRPGMGVNKISSKIIDLRPLSPLP
jgi:hypothetical protein